MQEATNSGVRTKAQPSTSRLKRGQPQRYQACKRCHERRSKCDAWAVGLPCTKCKRVRNFDCCFTESKRTRGPGGRFVTPATTDEHTTTQLVDPSPTVNHEPVPRWSTTRSVDEVFITLDLTELCHPKRLREPIPVKSGLEEFSRSSDKSGSGAPVSDPTRGGLFKCDQMFVGESWYASFLLRAINHENNKLQRLIEPHLYSPEADVPHELSESTNLPPNDTVTELLDAYFTRFHVLFPILNKANFHKNTVSPELLRCVLFVASMHCDEDVLHRMGYTARTKAMDDLFNQAKDAVEANPDAHRFIQLQCSFLLHHWSGQPTVSKDSAWWLSTAIRFAQCLGMHCSTADVAADERTKSHYRRIWWCLYIRDRQMSLCLGMPMVINDLDCDAEELTRNDFPDEEEDTAQYVIAQAYLAKVASHLYYCHLSPSRINLSTRHEYRAAAENQVLQLLEEWYDTLPALLRDARKRSRQGIALRILYNFWKVDFLLRLQRKASSSEHSTYIVECASDITRDVEDAVLYWKPEYFPPMIMVPAIFSAMTVQYVSAYSSSVDNADRRSLLSQQLRSNLLNLRQFEKCFIVARWIRNLFEVAMSRPSQTNHPPNNNQIHTVSRSVSPNASGEQHVSNYVPQRAQSSFYNDQQPTELWDSSEMIQNYSDIFSSSWEQSWEDIFLDS